MDAEKLKVIAEGMGYELRGSSSPYLTDRVVVWNGKDIHTRAIYNPLTNDSQCMEIAHKLKINTEYFKDIDEWEAWRKESDNSVLITINGKTINEAVCNAAYEYFNQ